MQRVQFHVNLMSMKNSMELMNYWLKEVVIGLDLCPFARIPYKKGLIRVVECSAGKLSEQVNANDEIEAEMVNFFIEELEFLNESSPQEVSTTLISFPYDQKNFLDFNDFVGDLEYLIEEAGLDDTYQLVGFHPDFYFASEDMDSRANYVNRSPFSVVHILRVEDFKSALSNPKDGEIISINNENKLKEMSKEELDKIFFYLK